MKFIFLILVLIPLAISNGTTTKIDWTLSSTLRTKEFANIFIELNDSTLPILERVKGQFRATTTHGEKTTQVYEALKTFSENSQSEILEFLNSEESLFAHQGIKTFWINNMIYIRGAKYSLIEQLALMDKVKRISDEPILDINNFYAGSKGNVLERGTPRIEWGVSKMRVPEVWDMGITGEGIIVGNLDTGVRGTHELLRDKWVGLENYGWWDPEGLTPDPHDVYNHGTHTCGNIVGDMGIGVAPDARWLACKGYRDDGSGGASTFLSCIEYMLCPNDYLGENRDCSKAPHVVTNSWGWQGGTTIFNEAIQAWVAAGILASFSAGNYAGCSTIYSPADQPMALAIGATTEEDQLLFFSSFGPSPYGDIKPELIAPGDFILSSSAANDTAYMQASGTSMSCPHASGVLVLLKSFDPNLSHEDAINALTQTAMTDLPSRGFGCGEIPDNIFPNHQYGYGIIDAYSAIQYLMKNQN